MLLSSMAFMLVGCSKKSGLYTIDNKVINDGVEVAVSEHVGEIATSIYGADNVEVTYELEESIEDCINNPLGILEEDMSEFKKGTYFTMFQGTEVVLHVPAKSGIICCHATLPNSDNPDTMGLIGHMYGIAENLKLHKYTEFGMDNIFTITAEGMNVKVRPGQVVIPSFMIIAKGEKTCDNVANIGDVQVGFTTEGSYDYYKYSDYIIKINTGADINQYVKIKEKK